MQEVDGKEAWSRVVDTDVNDVHVDDRLKWSLNGQQNTGFAFKRGLTVVRRPDVTALHVRGDGRLRYGARIDVTHQSQTIQLLSVHLKSGCFDNTTSSSDCALFLEQIPVLEGWIDAAAAATTPFIVLGGFNRRFTQPNDRVWADLDGGRPANADLTALTQDMPISCRDNKFTEFIDHIVVDRRVRPWVDRTSFRQVTDRQADTPVWTSSPTTARCSWSCGSGNVASRGEDGYVGAPASQPRWSKGTQPPSPSPAAREFSSNADENMPRGPLRSVPGIGAATPWTVAVRHQARPLPKPVRMCVFQQAPTHSASPCPPVAGNLSVGNREKATAGSRRRHGPGPWVWQSHV